MRLVVTGVNGFVGRHAARLAKQRGHYVIGIRHSRELESDSPDVDHWYTGDLAAAWPVDDEFDAVLHLAGLAAVGASFDDPLRYIEENAAIVVHLGEALLRGCGGSPRVLVVSTGAVYNARAVPIDEGSPISMSSPYVVSKRTAEDLADYYRRRGVDMVIARPFNHIGPGQAPGFLVPDLYRKLAAMSANVVEVGDLSTRRDYTDVRDVVDAYLSLLGAPSLEHMIYNVASGGSRAGTEVLVALCRAMGLAVPELRRNTSGRPIDHSEIIGDASRLRLELGWAPSIAFERSIQDFVTASEAEGVRHGL